MILPWKSMVMIRGNLTRYTTHRLEIMPLCVKYEWIICKSYSGHANNTNILYFDFEVKAQGVMHVQMKCDNLSLGHTVFYAIFRDVKMWHIGKKCLFLHIFNWSLITSALVPFLNDICLDCIWRLFVPFVFSNHRWKFFKLEWLIVGC